MRLTMIRWLRSSRGVTLIELIGVAVILGVLALLVVPNVGAGISRAKTAAFQTSLSELQSASDTFYAKTGAYPTYVGSAVDDQPGACPDAFVLNTGAQDASGNAFLSSYVRSAPDPSPADAGLSLANGSAVYYGVASGGIVFATQTPPETASGEWYDGTTPVVAQSGATTLASLCGGYAASGLQPSLVDAQVAYIEAHQLADGAIWYEQSSGLDEISPYFANYAAIGLADANTQSSDAAVLSYMQWYDSHLNSPDSYGLTDTVYDYTWDPATQVLTSKGTYDSVDGYAGTFLSLAWAAYRTRNPALQSYVSANVGTIEQIADLLTRTAGSGGVRSPNELTLSFPTTAGNYYTLDNAETYRGLADLSALESALGRSQQATYYADFAGYTQSAMLADLWDSSTSLWYWALDQSNQVFGGTAADLSTWYPDTVAQIWPITMGVVSPSSAYATGPWAAFQAAWPNWSSGQIGDSFPWVSTARAAEVMGDTTDATTYLNYLTAQYGPGGWQWPWYVDEAGWAIATYIHQ